MTSLVANSTESANDLLDRDARHNPSSIDSKGVLEQSCLLLFTAHVNHMSELAFAQIQNKRRRGARREGRLASESGVAVQFDVVCQDMDHLVDLHGGQDSVLLCTLRNK